MSLFFFKDDDIKVLRGPVGKRAFVYKNNILVPYTWHADHTEFAPATKHSHFDDHGNAELLEAIKRLEPLLCRPQAPRLKMYLLLSDMQTLFPDDKWLTELAASNLTQNQPIRKRTRESPAMDSEAEQIVIDVARIVGTELRAALTDINQERWKQEHVASKEKEWKREFFEKLQKKIFE